MTTRVAIGFDPGLGHTGFGIIARSGSRVQFIEAGTITTDSARPLEERQELIWQEATSLIREHRPVAAGLEDQSGVNAAARQSLARQLAAARKGLVIKGFGFNASNDGVIEVVGILKAVAFAYRTPVLMLQPRSIKVHVCGPGGGKAEKSDIKAAVRRIFPELRDARFSSHAADGIAAALCAERHDNMDSRRAS